MSSWSDLSKRDFAALEDRLVSKIGSTVKDPVLNSDLRSLGWLQRRVALSDDGNVTLHLKLPTLLHPEKEKLAHQVERVAKEELYAIAKKKEMTNVDSPVDVNVVFTTSPTVPVVARRPEEHDEIIKKLGPGLAKVAQFLAVYSCKVQAVKLTRIYLFHYTLLEYLIDVVFCYIGWRGKVYDCCKSCLRAGEIGRSCWIARR